MDGVKNRPITGAALIGGWRVVAVARGIDACLVVAPRKRGG